MIFAIKLMHRLVQLKRLTIWGGGKFIYTSAPPYVQAIAIACLNGKLKS